MSTIIKWEYSPSLRTWVFGTCKKGGGVLLDDQKWHGNVVHPNSMDVIGCGPFDFKEEAMEEVEIIFNNLEKSND